MDDKEIDAALAPLRALSGYVVLPARLLNDAVDAHQLALEVRTMIQQSRTTIAPFFRRGHWMLVVFTGNQCRVYDSARHRDLEKIAVERLEAVTDSAITFVNDAPRQARGSQQCGLFTIAAAYALVTKAHRWWTRRLRGLERMRGMPASAWWHWAEQWGGHKQYVRSDVIDHTSWTRNQNLEVTWKFDGDHVLHTWWARVTSVDKDDCQVEYFVRGRTGDFKVFSRLNSPPLYKGCPVTVVAVAPCVERKVSNEAFPPDHILNQLAVARQRELTLPGSDGPAAHDATTAEPDPLRQTVHAPSPSPQRHEATTAEPGPPRQTVHAPSPSPQRHEATTAEPGPPRQTVHAPSPSPQRHEATTAEPRPPRQTVHAPGPSPQRHEATTAEPGPLRQTTGSTEPHDSFDPFLADTPEAREIRARSDARGRRIVEQIVEAKQNAMMYDRTSTIVTSPPPYSAACPPPALGQAKKLRAVVWRYDDDMTDLPYHPPQEESRVQVESVACPEQPTQLQRSATRLPHVAALAEAMLQGQDQDVIETWGDAYPMLEEECVERAGIAVPRGTIPTYEDHQRPFLHTFSELRAVLSAPVTNPHPIAQRAITAGTRAEHKRVLDLVRQAPAGYDTWPVARALVECLARAAIQRKWVASTVAKKAASLQGALAILPMYLQAAPIKLTEFPEWKQAARTLGARAREQAPRAVKPCTRSTVEAAITTAQTSTEKAVIAICWLLAARVGDVLQLTRHEVTLDGNVLTVTYRKGKTVAKRGPYTVHSQVPQVWLPLVEQALATRSNTKLFPKITVSDVTKCLRKADAALESRSLRRGSLQLMANEGVDDNTLLLFSGHTSLTMLLRYLAWGAVGAVKKRVMTQSSAKLAPVQPLVGGEALPAPSKKQKPSGEQRSPAFINKLGMDAPATEEFMRMTNDADAYKRGSAPLPLHVKEVMHAISIDRLRTMAQDCPPPLRELAMDAFRWLDDTSRFPPPSPTARAACSTKIKLAKADVEAMLEKGKLQLLPSNGRERGARIFAVTESEKGRRRPIFEPHANDDFEATPTVAFEAAHARHRTIAKYRFAIQYDFASFYDQFGISDDVARLLACPYGQMALAPATLPMGFRPSCQVAQAATWILTENLFESNGEVMSYIDNVLLLSNDIAELKRASQLFVARCDEVGAILNPVAGPDDIVETVFDFLGTRYDLVQCQRSNTQKTLTKLEMARRALTTGAKLSRRNLAAIFGIALFASRVSDFSMATVFWPMRLFRDLASTTHWDEWDCPAPHIEERTKASLVWWLTQLSTNRPTPIVPPSHGPVDAHIFTDASGEGWGAVCCTDTGVQTAAGKWPPAISAYQQSSTAEPRAAICALARFVCPTWRHVVVVTDHQPLVFAGAKGHAHSYEYNRVLEWAGRSFPRARFVFRFVEGLANPADEPSRGKRVESSKVRAACAMLSAEASGETGESGSGGGTPWGATALKPFRPLPGKA